MRVKKIKGYSNKISKRLFDKIGALDKSIKMKRMEPYADIIYDVLAKYNQDDDSKTMMIKLLREPVEGTTTRKKHCENVEYIAGKIADHFDWLCSKQTRGMARNHDTGHTFLGHSGEWWLSQIKRSLGMGNYVHNALGARKLVYRNDFFEDVAKAILEKEPNISRIKLAKIKRDLWLIVDGINSHNGEKSEYSYAPDFSKSKKRFFDEIMGCFVKKDFDRTLEPATAEGSLMRLCDKISYIPFDLVDAFRNGCNIEKLVINGKEHNFYEEYKEKFQELGMPEDSLERLLNCKTNEEYDNFAYEMQELLIADVIKNTKRNNIRMSPEMSKVMHSIRDINNNMMVNYTVMKEDHKVYPAAMEKLMKQFAKMLIAEKIIGKNVKKSSITQFEGNVKKQQEFINKYKDVPWAKKFAEFIAKTNNRDFEFTVDMINQAFMENLEQETETAKIIASTENMLDIPNEIKGVTKSRLSKYKDFFRESLSKAYDANILNEISTGAIDDFKKKIWLEKTKKILKDRVISENKDGEETFFLKTLEGRVALELGAQFLSTLNDEEWKQLLFDANIVDNEKWQSLSRKYDTFDFRAESQAHKDWANIASLQAESTSKMDENKKVKKRWFSWKKGNDER